MKKTDLDDPESDPRFDHQVIIAELLLHNLRDLRSCGLAPLHYDLMLILKAQRRGQHSTLAQLAVFINSDSATCAAALSQLRRRGLVRNHPLDPHHSKGPNLTRRGENLLHRLCSRDRARWLRLAPSLLSSLHSPEDLR